MDRQYQRHIIVILNSVAYAEYEQVEKTTNGVRFSAADLNRIFGGARLDPVDGRTFELPDFEYVDGDEPYWLGVVEMSGPTTFFLHLARLDVPSPEVRATSLLQVDRSRLEPLREPLSADDIARLRGEPVRPASTIYAQLPARAREAIEEITRAFTIRDFTELARLLHEQGVPDEVLAGYRESLTTYLNFDLEQEFDWSAVTADSALSALSDGDHAYIDVPLLGVNGDVIHLVFDCWRQDGTLHVLFEHMNA